MALPRGTDVEYIGENASGGMCLGLSASELVSFHGSAPCDQAANVTAVLTTAAATGLIGFANTAQLVAATDAINSILVCLKEKGLMASA